MSRFTAVVAVVGLFLSGIVIGALGTHLYYAYRLRAPGGPPAMAAGLFVERLERRLDLRPEQAAEIEAILDRTHEAAAEMRRDLRPRVEELMERTADEIRAVLTAEQREAFDLLRRRERRRTDFLLLGPPGPHGHDHVPGPGPPPRRRPRGPGR